MLTFWPRSFSQYCTTAPDATSKNCVRNASTGRKRCAGFCVMAGVISLSADMLSMIQKDRPCVARISTLLPTFAAVSS